MKVPEADAEELASDVLYAVRENIHKFRPGGPAKLSTWIYEIAKNRAIDYLLLISAGVIVFLDSGSALGDECLQSAAADRGRGVLNYP
jgi:hypothetical protein